MFVMLKAYFAKEEYSDDFINSLMDSGELITPYMYIENMMFNTRNITTISADRNTGGSIVTMTDGNSYPVVYPLNELDKILGRLSVLQLNN